MTDKEILEEIEYNVLNDPFITFSQDSSWEDVQIKATAIEELVKRYKKQQKEIEYLKKQIPQDKIFYYSEKDYISKDKIREIISKYVDIEEHLVYHSQELWGEDLAEMIKELLGE